MELNGNVFKWWYAKGVVSYNELLEEKKTAQIIAMTRDGKIVRKTAPLSVEQNQIAIADCGAEGNFYLTPNQWVSPQRTDSVSKYWLIEKNSQKPNTPSVLGIYATIDDGVAVLPKGVELFGIPSSCNSTLTHRVVDAIVPIGDEKCIVFSEEGNTCIFIGVRETDESVIKIYQKRVGR